MRHKVKGRKLGRTRAHKKATMSSLCTALITHHRIVTTLPKAKELRVYVEPLITRAKEDSTHNRREVFSLLQDKKAVTHLFEEVGPKVGDRPGGYTRVIKIGSRQGDAADMAVIELVDYNDVKPGDTASKKKRTRRGGKGKAEAEAPAKAGKAKTTEAPAEEAPSAEAPIEEAAGTEGAMAEEVVAEAEAAEEATATEVKEVPTEEVSAEAEVNEAQAAESTDTSVAEAPPEVEVTEEAPAAESPAETKAETKSGDTPDDETKKE